MPVGPHRRVTHIRLKDLRMMATSTGHALVVDARRNDADGREAFDQHVFQADVGNRAAGKVHMTHSRCPRPVLRTFASAARGGVQPSFSCCELHTRGHQGAGRQNVPTSRSSGGMLG